MKKTLGYILLAIFFMAVSPGPETLKELTQEGRSISNAWLMFFPSTFYYLVAVVVVNNYWLVPKFLLKNKFSTYFLYASLLSFVASFLSSLSECALKIHFEFPNRIQVDSPIWIIEDSLANAFFLVLILVGLALIKLYDKWKKDLEQERIMSESLEKYLGSVRDHLNPATIFAAMERISMSIFDDRDRAVVLIDDLSAYLRKQLSELSAHPVIKETIYDKSLFSSTTTFLVSRRYGVLRYFIFLLIISFVSYSAFAHEHAGAPIDSAVNSVVLFAFLTIVSIIVMFWLFRRYEHRQDVGKYIRSISIFLAIIIAPILFSLLLVFNKADENGLLSPLLETFVFIAGIIGICLYVFGLSALLFFQNWIKVQRHITVLHNETIRQEYLFLRRQINPHFLFNVLNNIEISIFDDPHLASELLRNLIRLLEYQFEDSKRDNTILRNEVEFLKSYLSLEQSRRENFSYIIEVESYADEIVIPTLLFIPIVENAAKYSIRSEIKTNVRISFKIIGKYLKFECENPYDLEKVKSMSHHGIGLENTRQRLELIYDVKARFATSQSETLYNIEVIIPIE